MKKILVFALSVVVLSMPTWAKLPPLSDEAKGKAAEAAAKAAHAGKVDAYQLCKSQDKVAAHYLKASKTASKDAKPAAAAPCVDPGAYVAAPPAAAPAASTASAPALASAPTDKDKKKP